MLCVMAVGCGGWGTPPKSGRYGLGKEVLNRWFRSVVYP
jgi:hypothetical protein